MGMDSVDILMSMQWSSKLSAHYVNVNGQGLMNSDERKNKIGTPKLKTNFSVLGNIFLGHYFFKL